MGILAQSPGGESSEWSKTTADTGVDTPASSAWGHAHSSPMLCHPGAKRDHPSSLQTRLAAGCLGAGVMVGRHAPCCGTACCKQESPQPQPQHTQGHERQAWALQGIDGEKPQSPGTYPCSLPQQSRLMLPRSTVGPAPAGTCLKAVRYAHITSHPRALSSPSLGKQPRCLAPIPSPSSSHWGQCLASPLCPWCQVAVASRSEGKSLAPISLLAGWVHCSLCVWEPRPGAGCLGRRPGSSFPT